MKAKVSDIFLYQLGFVLGAKVSLFPQEFKEKDIMDYKAIFWVASRQKVINLLEQAVRGKV